MRPGSCHTSEIASGSLAFDKEEEEGEEEQEGEGQERTAVVAAALL